LFSFLPCLWRVKNLQDTMSIEQRFDIPLIASLALKEKQIL
jgi:hypothetical protein